MKPPKIKTPAQMADEFGGSVIRLLGQHMERATVCDDHQAELCADLCAAGLSGLTFALTSIYRTPGGTRAFDKLGHAAMTARLREVGTELLKRAYPDLGDEIVRLVGEATQH